MILTKNLQKLPKITKRLNFIKFVYLNAFCRAGKINNNCYISSIEYRLRMWYNNFMKSYLGGTGFAFTGIR